MPNRVIREGFLDSEKINSLSDSTQLFFVRLMLVADDYGRCDARPELLKSKCYPVSDIRPSRVGQMTDELKKTGLIIVYVVDNKSYLQINGFNQRTRIMRSKYPCPTDGRQMTDICQTDVGVNPIQSESDTESDTDTESEKKGNGFDEICVVSNLGDNFKTVWNEWKQYRKEKKKQMTPRTIKAQLEKLSQWGSDSAIASIRQSIENGWEGLFPVKASYAGSKFGPQPLTRELLESQYAMLAAKEVTP